MNPHDPHGDAAAAPLRLCDDGGGLAPEALAAALAALRRGEFSLRLAVEGSEPARRVAEEWNAVAENAQRMREALVALAHAAGREGQLRARADAGDLAGGWAEGIDAVNGMLDQLSAPAAELSRVIGAVADGDLTHKLEAEVSGDLLYLKRRINGMVDRLAACASEVSRVAREVGIEGRLGGQAQCGRAAGAWRDMVDNVNSLAERLTSQVRAISEVATAVTHGDLSRPITIDARGEVAELKDHLNGMIWALRESTRDNEEQVWLNAHLARFTRLLQEQRDLPGLSSRILAELAPLVSARLGAFYINDASTRETRLVMVAGYGCRVDPAAPLSYAVGEGIVGQCAVDMRRMLLKDVPAGYLKIASGLGSASPACIVVLPIVTEHGVKAVIELASLKEFTAIELSLLDQLMESIAVVFHTLEANNRTESMLAQSQSLARELGRTNLELAEKARLLAVRNSEVERKNAEVEDARRALEEKAAQLALSSRYKSEFLANMSHELRTPLNSLLILAEQLAENPKGNLDARQLEFARTIHAAGSDLLSLINDILDLSKIESGTVSVDLAECRFDHLHAHVERAFRHIADARGLRFDIALSAQLPASMHTDFMRLQQILRNLLANAFKFTAKGSVSLRIERAASGWSEQNPSLREAGSVIGFTVADTGIGIEPEKLRLIFEAFQQADGSTARKYGGTGLGLSISRELARLLGGEIGVRSEPHVGSEFTLYLPLRELPAAPERMASLALPGRGGSHLLLVEDDAAQRSAAVAAFAEAGWRVSAAENGGQGLQLLKSGDRVDCMVFDLHLPDIDGVDLLDMIAADTRLHAVPIVVHTAAQPDAGTLARLARLARAIVTKDPDSPRRLVQEVERLFQPQAARVPEAAFPPLFRNAPLLADRQEDAAGHAALGERKVLIVDDDLRNIFALSSLVERHGMTALFAENGREAIELLAQHADVDIVLMDVMMPEMDGYDTMRAIRLIPECARLPIIALTAKAMTGDREKCLAAGASDYIAKPVESARLLDMMAAWLTR
jgi:signal transduction histidine kinase/CheY-like chemotaxis protein/HAMP domain-containing protein